MTRAVKQLLTHNHLLFEWTAYALHVSFKFYIFVQMQN